MTTMIDRETLDASTWFERMARLTAALGQGDGALDRHIRKAYHLHCLAPDAIKRMMSAPIEEARLEAMLECGAYDSAVGCLTGTEEPIEISPLARLEAWAASFLHLRPGCR